MRYLILGDIHGNLPALELVLKKEKNNYDTIISHGDVVNYGPWSNECVDLLQNIDDIVLLKGNHEDYFINGIYTGTHPVAMAFFDFNIKTFNRVKELSAYENNFHINNYTVQHTIDNKYIFNDTEIIIDRNYIIGHSHQQFVRNINNHELINTGSVGQNRGYINVINYVLYNSDLKQFKMQALCYDHSVIINEFKNRGYPDICINYYTNKKVLAL